MGRKVPADSRAFRVSQEHEDSRAFLVNKAVQARLASAVIRERSVNQVSRACADSTASRVSLEQLEIPALPDSLVNRARSALVDHGVKLDLQAASDNPELLDRLDLPEDRDSLDRKVPAEIPEPPAYRVFLDSQVGPAQSDLRARLVKSDQLDKSEAEDLMDV